MATESFSLFDLVPGKLIAGRYRILRAHRHSGLSATFEAVDESRSESRESRSESRESRSESRESRSESRESRSEDGKEHRELTIFPSALFEQPSQVEEYRQTLEPWKGVQSPHVLRVRELLLLDPSTLALVTDFPRGESMRVWLKQHTRLGDAGARSLGFQLLDGLDAIHKKRLVHGDIKPQTIHVAPERTERSGGPDSRGGPGDPGLFAQLVDGGVTPGLWNAKHLGDRTALIGTPFYAPVEQFGGESPDVQSDIYNVATVLFEVATGVLPWPGSSFLEVFQAKLDKHPPSMRRRAPSVEVEPALERAIVGGLLADRRERYPDSATFRRALEAVPS